MQGLRRIETPIEIKDVIKRRFQSAPSSLLKAAFGEPKLNVHTWGDNHRYAVGFGSNKFRTESESRYSRLGDAFPGIERSDVGFTSAVFRIQGNDISIGRMTLSGGDGALTIDAGASVFLYDAGIKSNNISPYVIEYLFIGTSKLPVNFSFISEMFEIQIVKYMSPFYHRGPHADKSS